MPGPVHGVDGDCPVFCCGIVRNEAEAVLVRAGASIPDAQHKGPYVVRYVAGAAQVIVHSTDCREALRWLRDLAFTGSVSYVCSDFDNNHTFECSVLAGVNRG
tara:strand:- start:1644 stop:1952 length:309 start_codon:yes stop_codon:yes gene_type:complete